MTLVLVPILLNRMALRLLNSLYLRSCIGIICILVLYPFISVTTSLNDRRAEDELRLFVVLIVGEELFLLVHELIDFHGADLCIAN